MKALGIDFGEARIGVAGSDDLGMLAHPVETIEVKKVDAVPRIVAIASERRAGVVVVGMPYRLDGSRGTAAEKVERFVGKLREALPASVGVETFDERLTTTAAQAKLHAAGRTVKDSRSVIDQAAAVEILQGWLDERAGAGA